MSPGPELHDQLQRMLTKGEAISRGCRVRVEGRPRNQDLLGKTGEVKSVWADAMVEIDGIERHLTFNSLEPIEDSQDP